jgi:hypothetical protein
MGRAVEQVGQPVGQTRQIQGDTARNSAAGASNNEVGGGAWDSHQCMHVAVRGRQGEVLNGSETW